jgi:two-component system CheB/CheR fusion protein
MAATNAGGSQAGFVKIFRDVTHLRTRMAYLENVQHEAIVRQHEQDLFIGTIAHEMRNPLSPLKTALELMKRQPGDGPQAHALEIMGRQIGFLERLIEDLVDLTRFHASKMSIAYEKVAPPVSIEIEVDARRLLQVVQNLLNNAIKYTQAGGNVWLTATVDQTHFVCYVKHDGQGISPELLPRIFEMFTQAGSHAERGAGLGIGLSVVKEIVALHRGTVEVRSEGPGRGSEFIVRIPQRPRDGVAAEARSEPQA